MGEILEEYRISLSALVFAPNTNDLQIVYGSLASCAYCFLVIVPSPGIQLAIYTPPVALRTVISTSDDVD